MSRTNILWFKVWPAWNYVFSQVNLKVLESQSEPAEYVSVPDVEADHGYAILEPSIPDRQQGANLSLKDISQDFIGCRAFCRHIIFIAELFSIEDSLESSAVVQAWIYMLHLVGFRKAQSPISRRLVYDSPEYLYKHAIFWSTLTTFFRGFPVIPRGSFRHGSVSMFQFVKLKGGQTVAR